MNQLLSDAEIESLYFNEIDRRELSFARAIEQAILSKLNSAEPRSYLYKHHYYDGSFVFSHKDTLNGSPCIEAIPLYEHPPAPSAVEWVSVEDRLPEDGTYLCSGHSGTQFICLMRNGRWLRQSAAKGVVGITHWLPLPQPPVSAARSDE